MNPIDLLIERYPVLAGIRAEISAAAALMIAAYEHGGKLLIAGNGGSCADAEHIVGELMKGFCKKRPMPAAFADAVTQIDAERGAYLAAHLQGGLPAIALDNHAALNTAFMNDVDAALIYAQQVNVLGGANDVFFGISTSGNAKNVQYAAITAKAKGMKVIALTGGTGGTLAKLADVALVMPEKETYMVQELHLPVYHALCLMLENHFWAE